MKENFRPNDDAVQIPQEIALSQLLRLLVIRFVRIEDIKSINLEQLLDHAIYERYKVLRSFISHNAIDLSLTFNPENESHSGVFSDELEKVLMKPY